MIFLLIAYNAITSPRVWKYAVFFFCFTSSLVINTLQMVLNYFVGNMSAESSSFFCSCIESSVLRVVKKKQSIKQADRHDSENTWGTNMLNIGDILKSNCSVYPYTQLNILLLQKQNTDTFIWTSSNLCQSQINSSLQSEEQPTISKAVCYCLFSSLFSLVSSLYIGSVSFQ